MEASLSARDVVGVEDFVLLEDYSNIAAFVDNLRKRFRESLIYVSSSVENCYIPLFHFSYTLEVLLVCGYKFTF